MSKLLQALLAALIVALFAALFFYPPQTAGDMASWIQAFGSMGAIGLAIGLQQFTANERKVQATAAVAALGRQIFESIKAMKVEADNFEHDRLMRVQAGVRDALQMGLQIPVGDLDASTFRTLLRVRVAGMTAIAAELGGIDSGEVYQKQLADCRDALQTVGVIVETPAVTPTKARVVIRRKPG